jgi:hypothetical protein
MTALTNCIIASSFGLVEEEKEKKNVISVGGRKKIPGKDSIV